jgi:hypothetical protein
MQQYLYDEYEVHIGTRTITDYLHRAKWSRKAVKARAKERSEPLRAAWRGLSTEWDDKQLVFLDESAANERTGDRKRGWAPIGVRCGVDIPIKRLERWSILLVLTNKGYLDWVIYQGAISADLFISFIKEKVLPYCESYLGKRSVLVLDNALIYKDRRLQIAYDDAGVLLQFLPPYSPNYNPIESTFGSLKAWIKANYIPAAEFE